MIEEDQEIDDLFLDEEAIEPLAGEIGMEELSDDKLVRVENRDEVVKPGRVLAGDLG